MFNLAEHVITRPLQKHLHKKRASIINEAMDDFANRHNNSRPNELSKKLNIEADRIYPMVDQSIARERIERAKVTTAITGLASIAISLIFGLSMFAPLIAIAVATIASIATIPISYNARVRGAMDSVTALYEKELTSNNSAGNSPANQNLAPIQPLQQYQANQFSFPAYYWPGYMPSYYINQYSSISPANNNYPYTTPYYGGHSAAFNTYNNHASYPSGSSYYYM